MQVTVMSENKYPKAARLRLMREEKFNRMKALADARDREAREKDCPDCAGWGYIRVDGMRETCKSCNGKGRGNAA
jgi:DnaJ-class molecular chaperone